jgi:hypothetical protein
MPLTLNGTTSGGVTLNAPAVAGTNTLTLPAATDTLATEGFVGTVAAPIAGGTTAFEVGPATEAVEAPQWQQVFAGNNAQYVNQLANRSFNTTFTNSSDRPIDVVIEASAPSEGSGLIPIINGVTITGTIFDNIITINFRVPVGATYEVENSGSPATLNNWFEL